MDYKLDSDKLKHPLLKEVLEQLIPVFKRLDVQYYIIGATARDIIMELNDEKSSRRTKDVDFAIAISNWEKFEEVEQELLKKQNFKKNPKQKQQFLYLDEFELDIVPYGAIKSTDDKIFWPPDETFAMSVLGFEEVEKDLISVKIDNDFEIQIASLVGIFLLKMMAWKDRHIQGNKDADDLGFILLNYLNIFEKRAALEYYDQVYELSEFTQTKGGAVLIGIDLNLLLRDSTKPKTRLIEIIAEEISQDTESKLFNQINDTHINISFDEIKTCFELMHKKLIE